MICLHAATSLVCIFIPSSLMVDCRKEQPLTMRIARDLKSKISIQHRNPSIHAHPRLWEAAVMHLDRVWATRKYKKGLKKKWHIFYVPFPFGHFLSSQEQLSRSGSKTQSGQYVSPKQRCQQPMPYRRIKTSEGWGGSSITQSQLSMQQVLSLKLNNTCAHACTHTLTSTYTHKKCTSCCWMQVYFISDIFQRK